MGRHKKAWRDFDEARAHVRQLHLKNQDEWKVYCRSGQRPDDIPTNPHIVYQGRFLGYGDWLDTSNIATLNRTFRPFEEAKEYVRQLHLKNFNEWQAYCHSEQSPLDIPINPAQIYPEFRGYGDWLGTHQHWNRKRVQNFLEHLSHHAHLLTEKELYLIAQQEGVLPLINETFEQSSPMQAMQLLQENASQAIAQAQQYKGHDSPDPMMMPSGETSSDWADTSLAHDHETRADQQLSSLSQSSAEASILTSTASLQSFDHLGLSVDLHADVIDYLIANRVNLLWEYYSHSGEQQALPPSMSAQGGPFFSAIRDRFLEELQQVQHLSSHWSFQDQTGYPVPPNIMQRRTAWEVLTRRRIGNWSGTGSGKTLAAIFASRVIDAHITLIITNCVTVAQWSQQIQAAYPDSLILTQEKHIPSIQGEERNTYIILNYEKFQQQKNTPLLTALHALPIDFLVLDEVQMVKQRQTKASKRRTTIQELIHQAERNPDLRVLGLSATPVINNVTEGKTLLELIVGTPFPEINGKATVKNALYLHQELMRHGFRIRPRSQQHLAVNKIAVVRNDLADMMRDQQTILQIEQALLPAKLAAMKEYIRPGTLLYTQYVQGMLEPIQRFVRSLGYSTSLLHR